MVQNGPWRTRAALAALASATALTAPQIAQAGGPVKPLYGDISPFYGDISPFYGDISPFYGDISPFYGDISPFWGDISPFWGDISPFYGDISPFWGTDNPVFGSGAPAFAELGPFWAKTGKSWDGIAAQWRVLKPSVATPADYKPVADKLKDLVADSRVFWAASVQAKTGKDFDAGFANAVLAKHKIDLNDPASLAKLSETQRALFFLDWYDGLMAFTGTDRVDHWMKGINWTPSLTTTQGAGGSTTIGILDMTVVKDATIRGSVVRWDGVSDFTNGHGAAAGEVLVLAVRDSGIGIPKARLEDVFESFRQVDGSITRAYGGTGLGLAICRKLAHAMGGEIFVQSALGEGSTFTVRLPLERAAGVEGIAREAAVVPEVLADCRLLLADGNPLSQAVVRAALQPASRAIEVTNAYAEAAEAAESGRFDLILVEGAILGPDPDTRASAVFSLAACAAPARVAVLIGGAEDEEVARLIAAGAAQVIRKPITAAALVAELADGFAERHAASAAAA